MRHPEIGQSESPEGTNIPRSASWTSERNIALISWLSFKKVSLLRTLWWIMQSLFIKHRCSQFAILLILLTGTFYYFQYNIIDVQSLTDDKLTVDDLSNLTDNKFHLIKEELWFLRQFTHLLWLPDTITDKYVFGTYDNARSPIIIGRLVIYHMINSSNGDYIKFVGDKDLRAMYGLQAIRKYMFGRETWIPENSEEFLRKWNSGQFLDCIGLNISTSNSTPVIANSYIDNVAKFRDFIDSYQSTPFLFGGTLLGWYRECSFIKDTTDVDLATKIVSLNVTMLEDAEQSKEFSLYWILGKVNDSLELSVYSASIKIDLFFLFEEKDFAWVGGMVVSEKKKLRWVYPPIPRLCTGDLLGRLFHVPCNVEEVLEADYGNWTIPHPTEKFIWNKSHKNIHEAGYWNKSEWNDVYKIHG